MTFVSRQMSLVASHWLIAIQSVVSKHWCLFQRRAATLAIADILFCPSQMWAPKLYYKQMDVRWAS